jgi:ribonucleotide monophosphatase NagD (HAD superfamily)
MKREMVSAQALPIDIDGVLTVSWKPLRGAVDALRTIHQQGLPFALITNTTSRTRRGIAATLAGEGFPVNPEDVLTAPAAAAAYLREYRPDARCLLLNSGDIDEDGRARARRRRVPGRAAGGREHAHQNPG